MRFVLAAYYPPYSPSRYEVCLVDELAHHVLHAVGENRHLECPALQVVYNISRESRVCRERIVNTSKVEMARQTRDLVMT
jgi:hypothetical protein